jgi:hypothetical protein
MFAAWDPVVGRSSTGLVDQCRTAADLEPLQQQESHRDAGGKGE